MTSIKQYNAVEHIDAMIKPLITSTMSSSPISSKIVSNVKNPTASRIISNTIPKYDVLNSQMDFFQISFLILIGITFLLLVYTSLSNPEKKKRKKRRFECRYVDDDEK